MFSKMKRKTIALRYLIVLSFILLSVIASTSTLSLATTSTTVLNSTTRTQDSLDTYVQELIVQEEDDNSSTPSLNFDSLYNYIARHYSTPDFGFRDQERFLTASATYYGYMILKMLGFERYVIFDEVVKSRMYTNFSLALTNEDLRGYAEYETLEPSLLGTYSILSFLETADRPSYIQQNVNGSSQFIIEDCLVKPATDSWGFKETDNEEPTLVSTYYALKTLEILDNQLNNSGLVNLANFIASYWQGSYFNDTDTQHNAIFDTWFAVYALDIIQSHGVSLPSSLTSYETALETWIVGLQDGTWGGLGLEDTPTSDETGAAMAVLRKLDILDSSSLNQTKAINFIIESQFLNDTLYRGHGGFSPNKNTHLAEYHYVTIERSYWAIMGLFSADFFLDQLIIDYETAFYREQTTNEVAKYDIIQGQETDVYYRISYNNKRSMTKGEIVTDITNFNFTTPVRKDDKEIELDDIYYTILNLNYNGTNWDLGNHTFTVNYSTKNFTLFEVQDRDFNITLNVRYAFDLAYPLDDNNDGNLSPGEKLAFLVEAYNISIIKGEEIQNNFPFGQINVTVYDPKGDIVLDLLDTYNWPPFQNQTYINMTLPIIQLGDYRFQMVHWNNTSGVIFSVTTLTITISDTVYLAAITGNRDLNPGNPYTMTLTYHYQYSHEFPNDANITIGFVSQKTGVTLFTEQLEWVSGFNYRVNTNITVPNKILMGSYNISSTIFWMNRDGSYFTNPKDAINSTLPVVTIKGVPVLLNIDAKPFSDRGDSNIVYYGEDINITATIGILLPDDSIIDVNESIVLRADVVNRTSLEVLQQIESILVDNQTVRFTGQIDANLVAGDYYGFSTKVLSRYNNSFIDLIDNSTNIQYSFNMSIAGTLELQNIFYQIPATNVIKPTIIIEETPTVITEFEVFCTNDLSENNLVSNVELVAKIRTSGMLSNESLVTHGVSIFGDFYQLTFPIQGFLAGEYIIEIFRVVDDQILGSFEIILENEVIEIEIPLINYITVALVGIAGVLTLFNLNKRFQTE
jgi:hypothetical protein